MGPGDGRSGAGGARRCGGPCRPACGGGARAPAVGRGRPAAREGERAEHAQSDRPEALAAGGRQRPAASASGALAGAHAVGRMYRQRVPGALTPLSRTIYDLAHRLHLRSPRGGHSGSDPREAWIMGVALPTGHPAPAVGRPAPGHGAGVRGMAGHGGSGAQRPRCQWKTGGRLSGLRFNRPRSPDGSMTGRGR